jgi:thiosulfate/3-mercaptopyruvate sulfurtransferase
MMAKSDGLSNKKKVTFAIQKFSNIIMIKSIFTKLIPLLIIVLACNHAMAQNPENWTKSQLMEPAQLAQQITTGKQIPLILSIGPGALIKHSVDIGSVSDEEALYKLQEQLKNVPKDTSIVVYCGCCPFAHCPNIRPAIQVLKDKKFTNYKLLNLEHNLKTDWLDKGYPTVK